MYKLLKGKKQIKYYYVLCISISYIKMTFYLITLFISSIFLLTFYSYSEYIFLLICLLHVYQFLIFPTGQPAIDVAKQVFSL